jgi:hypothetical protein
MSCIIESPLWRVIIFLNTLLLLFGSEVQDLCIHPEGDIIMDVFFTIAMVAFFFDIIMRCFLKPTYMPRVAAPSRNATEDPGVTWYPRLLIWPTLRETVSCVGRGR